MNFKLFLAFAVLGVCTAELFGQKYITVDHEGSFIQVHSDNGMTIKIVKNKLGGAHGLKNFDVILTGQDYYKKIHIDDQLGGDVVFDLLARYEGQVDDTTFQRIMYQIEQYVQNGDVHPRFWHMLQVLFNVEHVKYLNFEDISGVGSYKFQQRQYGNDFVGKNFYNTRYYNQYPTEYTPSFWNQMLYKKQTPFAYEGLYHGLNSGLYGNAMLRKQLETPFEREVEGQIEHQVYGQTPFQYRGLNAGLYRNAMLHKQMETPFEYEIEREVQGKFEHPLVNKIYGQSPFEYRGLNAGLYRNAMLHKQMETPFAGQFQHQLVNRIYGQQTPFEYGRYNGALGMNQYGYNNYYGNYLSHAMSGNTMYDRTPMNNYYNMWMGYQRLPVTAY